jgi:hypothetical protein
MSTKFTSGRFEQFVLLGTTGTIEAVDFLMDVLENQADFATTRLVDYALSLVWNRAGVIRIRHYLFNGSRIQRNDAALYFKRRGFIDLLQEAVDLGMIDYIQAFAK